MCLAPIDSLYGCGTINLYGKDLLKKYSNVLFLYSYSLFIVLYPIGAGAEMFCIGEYFSKFNSI